MSASKQNMSDDEREVDIDSGEEEGDENGSGGHVDKRAHHNALERKRRDHIKESFTGLRDAVPTMSRGDKSSRAQILKKASDYISIMRKKNASHQREIEELKTQNGHLEAQIRALERAKSTGQFESPEEVLEANGLNFEVGTAEDAAAAAQAAAEAEDMASKSNSNGNGATVVQVVSASANGAPGRTIQPGQSLLIMANNGEPQRKKLKP